MRGAEAILGQLTHHTIVFNEAVMATPFPRNFKMPGIPLYSGREDPAAYVEVIHSWMDFERLSELARYRALPLTLSGLAQSWHSKLPSKSITSFEQ